MPLTDDGNVQSQKDSLKAFIDSHIKSDDVVIFSRTTCQYCDLVKSIFNQLNQKYTAVELDDRPDYHEIMAIFNEMTGEKTVPRVFIRGDCIGGLNDSLKMFIDTHVKSEDVVIFSVKTCRFCAMTKNIFIKMKYKYKVVELDERPDFKELMAVFKELTGEDTVPRVFVKGECVGGAFKTNSMFVTGELHRTLGVEEPENRHMEGFIDL